MTLCHLFYRSVPTLWRPALLVLLLLLLAACRVPGQREGEVLPFETIEQQGSSGTGGLYESEQPTFHVLTSAEQVDQLARLVTAEAQMHLSALDYDEVVVVVVFQGWKPTNGYGVEVEQVVRRGNRVVVEAQFTERNPEMAAADEETSPYHVVAVSKAGEWGEDVRFLLHAEGQVVQEQTYFIP